MKIFLIVLGIILGLVLIVFPVILFFVSGGMVKKMLVKSDKPLKAQQGMDISFYEKGPMKKASEEGLKYMDTLEKEEITMTSFDGYKLHAFYFPNPSATTNKFVLGMHGFKSGPLHEYAPYIKKYFELGFNVFIPDERSHFRSEGKYITMGINERFDTLDWLKLMIDKFGSDIEILLHGVSMGAATVTLASSLDLPKQVKGIISDCAYSSFEDIMASFIKKTGSPVVKPIIKMLELYLKMFLHLDFKTIKSVESVKQSKVPIMFVHGKLDQIVPVECSYKLYEACGAKKKLWIVEEANHAESIGYRKDEYFNNIKEFFEIK